MEFEVSRGKFEKNNRFLRCSQCFFESLNRACSQRCQGVPSQHCQHMSKVIPFTFIHCHLETKLHTAIFLTFSKISCLLTVANFDFGWRSSFSNFGSKNFLATSSFFSITFLYFCHFKFSLPSRFSYFHLASLSVCAKEKNLEKATSAKREVAWFYIKLFRAIF